MNKKQLLLYIIEIFVLYLMTVLVNVNIGTFGYLCMIDAFILLFAPNFKPGYAALLASLPAVAGFLTLNCRQYLLAICLIKGAEGWLVSFASQRKVKPWLYITLTGIFVLAADGLTDVLLYGSLSMFKISVGYHAIEIALCVILALVLSPLWARIYQHFSE